MKKLMFPPFRIPWTDKQTDRYFKLYSSFDTNCAIYCFLDFVFIFNLGKSEISYRSAALPGLMPNLGFLRIFLGSYLLFLAPAYHNNFPSHVGQS